MLVLCRESIARNIWRRNVTFWEVNETNSCWDSADDAQQPSLKNTIMTSGAKLALPVPRSLKRRYFKSQAGSYYQIQTLCYYQLCGNVIRFCWMSGLSVKVKRCKRGSSNAQFLPQVTNCYPILVHLSCELWWFWLCLDSPSHAVPLMHFSKRRPYAFKSNSILSLSGDCLLAVLVNYWSVIISS